MNKNKNNLFDDSEESDKDIEFNTNADYAKSYNKFRQKELLKKYKDRNDVSESDSSDESDSTEEDEIIDPKFDQEFFKTLSSLKSKDPTIYDKNTRFFDGVELEVGQNKKQAPAKPVTLKDYERKIILEKEGKFEDDSENENENYEENERAASPTYVEEQRRLKDEFRKVIDAENSDDEEFGGIFKKRVKTKEENEKEEADFTKWLAGKKDDVEEEVKKSLGPLKNYWSNAKLPQREKFLRDYILNQGYAETNFADIPTYEEIVGEDENLSEDEVELEKQEEFEHKYNFRFEEPDSEFIKRYPRTIEQSVRKTDDSRKQKRQEIKERKAREKQQKMQELEMIKAMKRKEIEEKIMKLKEVTGNDELGFKDEELEDEFDPEAHDRRMQELFNDEYYQVDADDEKPECPDIDELKVEDWDNYDPERDDYEPHCEDEDFNMDCDYDPNAKEALQQELIENTRDKRKKRKRNRFAEVIKAEKPVFNPDDEKTYGEYIEEYYKLDCEDIIGDLPCRFKYTETVPNDFGLTIEEILLAKNKELNQWASLKKAVQIRPDYVEKKEQRLYKMKANNEALKRKIFKSLYGEGSDEEDGEEDNQPTTSNQSQKKRKAAETITSSNSKISKPNEEQEETKNDADLSVETTKDESKVEAGPSSNTEGEKKKKKKKKKKKNNTNTTTATTQVEDQKTSANKNQMNKTAQVEKTSVNKNQAKNNKNQKVEGKSKSSANNPFKSKMEQGKHINGKPNAVNTAKKNLNQNKFNQKKSADDDKSSQITDDRLKAYGINPRKFHNTKKFGKKSS
ncbi:protein KRI1 homolog [Episyrphus balteatus]|uniref:protein KRI1 homolog n=1 Tax=Episyrphus balteatus TaxID=286459 RepID=UPI0024865D5C|nr:protein KRI1 homolog [Episyrphus balteatus]